MGTFTRNRIYYRTVSVYKNVPPTPSIQSLLQSHGDAQRNAFLSPVVTHFKQQYSQ